MEGRLKEDVSPVRDSDEERIRRLIEFWNQLRVSDDTGMTSWKILEPLERQVTEALSRRTRRDIALAESRTALAKLRITGQGG